MFSEIWVLRLCQTTAPLGSVAVLAGWTVTEVGRQPWIVYGVLRTAQSVTPSLTAADVMGSLLAHMALYLAMYPAGAIVLFRLIRGGCGATEASEQPVVASNSRGFSRTFARSQENMGDGSFDLVPIWSAIMALAVFLYGPLNRFDLGVGILRGFAPKAERSRMMNAIAPVWGGNETWPVLGGLSLLAIVPVAYAIIISAVYFPMLAMLMALVLRGVAFEFRFRQTWAAWLWSRGFCGGSAIVAFAQGVVVGSFIQDVAVAGRAFVGSSWDWLTLFSVLTGLSLMAGSGPLGAGWLIL